MKKNDFEKKTVPIAIRVSPILKSIIIENAEMLGIPYTVFIRFLCLSCNMFKKVKNPTEIGNKIKQIIEKEEVYLMKNLKLNLHKYSMLISKNIYEKISENKKYEEYKISDLEKESIIDCYKKVFCDYFESIIGTGNYKNLSYLTTNDPLDINEKLLKRIENTKK